MSRSHTRSVDWSDPNQWHYGPSVFPLMDADELEALTEDIRANGLLNPIARADGKILDGRNRALACRAAQVSPTFRDIPADKAQSWAISQNLFRRNLKPEHGALALEVLGAEAKKISKKTMRAYRKLKILKEELRILVEQAQKRENILEELNRLIKPKKVKVLLFRRLHERVFQFLPSISDGEEHTFIIDIQEALSSEPENENEFFYKSTLIRDFKEAAEQFLNYAKRLEEK